MYLQEECLSEEKEADMEEKTVTSKEWFGEDYGVVLKHAEQTSSDESFPKKRKRKKRIIRDADFKLKNCRCMNNIMKKLGSKMFEKDENTKREQRKHCRFAEKSRNIIKTPGLMTTSQNKKRSEKGKSKGKVKLIISLYMLSSLFIMSVLCICYPQCCDYYREYQIITYTGGTRPT